MSDETPQDALEISDADAQALLEDTEPDKGTGTTTFTQADVDRLIADRLTRERKKYADYGDLKKAAAAAKTVEQQLEELRGQLSERDQREQERNGRLALSQLNTRLAEAGIKREDVEGLLKRISPTDLLTDGEPNEAAISDLAGSLTKIAGRATPDPDQGKAGGKGPVSMNQLIRQAAGFR